MNNTLTQDELQKFLSYNAETGEFRWLLATTKRVKAGSIAGNVHDGRLHIGLLGKTYKAHRLAWLYVYGVWPASGIDHIDGNPLNNRISNLREATQAENMQNLKRHKKNNKSSGLLGVTFSKWASLWRAKIRVNGKHVHIGYFKTKEAAHEAYLKAKKENHPFQTIA